MARTGMTALIEELRGMTEAGTAEYTVGTTSYWGDNSLQDILDSHRTDWIYQQLTPYPVTGSGGTLNYYDYRAPTGFFEQTTGGSSIFYLQDGAGSTLGTALWTADYRRGQVTFSTTTAGSTIYLTGRSYDLNAAAADVWNKKAAHYAPTSFDFSTDNHRVDHEQVYLHCRQMAGYFQGMSGDALQTVERYRSDM